MNLPDLNHASRRDLIKDWRCIFKSHEPEKVGPKILRTCLATQSQRQGHVQAINKVEAKLMSRLKRHEAGEDALPTHSVLSPGTEIMRNYRGQTYTETVRDTVFEWNGTHYGSLSEIATNMTGLRRSGSKFFGLNG